MVSDTKMCATLAVKDEVHKVYRLPTSRVTAYEHHAMDPGVRPCVLVKWPLRDALPNPRAGSGPPTR